MSIENIPCRSLIPLTFYSIFFIVMEIWDKVLIYLGHAMAFPQFSSMEFYHTNAAVDFLYYFRAKEIVVMTLVQSMAVMTNGLPTRHKIRSEK